LTKRLKDNLEFISKLKNGDEDAYAQLIDLYHHKLCIHANSLTNDFLSAEDIVQNVFIKFWKVRHRLNQEYSIEAVLYRSVYNEFIDQYRKNQTKLQVEQHYYKHLNSIVQHYDDKKLKDALKLIYEVVETLPIKCKEVFILSKKDGLSNMEIAVHLNVSIKTVEGQISKAYKAIRKTLKGKIVKLLFALFETKTKLKHL